MRNKRQAAVLLAAIAGVLAGSGFTLPKILHTASRRAMPAKTPDQIALETQADKERHEWNEKRDAAYLAKKAAKGKKAHWSAYSFS